MPGFLRSFSQLYQSQLERHRNRPFLRAAMAGCAMVAMASGSVTFRQRIRVDHLMETLDALKVFDPHEGVELFNELVDGMKTDPERGHQQAMDVVTREVAEEPEKAELLVRICLAVSERNGMIPVAEKREIAGLCRHIGIDLAACGLDEQGPYLTVGDQS